MSSARHDADFSHSLTDLMSGLAVMFLLVAAIFMVQAAKATRQANLEKRQQQRLAEDRKRDADELEQLKRRDTRSIERLRELKRQLEGNARLGDRLELDYDPAKDPLLLTIRFTNENLQFPAGECAVAPAEQRDLRATLAELFPDLCRAVAPIGEPGITQTITLEGHTDWLWPLGGKCGMVVAQACGPTSRSASCQRQAFENNVRLSAARAQYVFFQAREVLRDALVAKCLDDYFVVAGRGAMNPIARAGSSKNRRVEIKVRVMAASAMRAGEP